MTRSKIEEVVNYGLTLQRLHDSAIAALTLRVSLKRPLTRHQTVVASLLAECYTQKEIAAATGMKERTIRWHIARAANRIPGNLPPTERVRVWYRGATIQVLCGRAVFDPIYPPPERQAVSTGETALSSEPETAAVSSAHPGAGDVT